MPPALAAGVSVLVALVAWRARALTGSGAVAATVVGLLILWHTGWSGFAVLGAYFASSTLVGRLAVGARAGTADPADEIRNHRQVLANGGLAAVLAPAELLHAGLGFWLVTVVLAASAADTWATGVGALSPRPPRDILRWRVVPPGTSGGVTWFGSSGGLAGAALVALAGAAAEPDGGGRLYLAATGLGWLGMLVDSAAGSAVQGRFHCPRCDRPTERRVHGCGSRTAHRRGWRWLDNDGVNALSTAVAGALGALAWHWWASP